MGFPRGVRRKGIQRGQLDELEIDTVALQRCILIGECGKGDLDGERGS